MDNSYDNKHIRAAVIGMGSMGRNHARIYHEMNNVRLTAVADIDENNLMSNANRFQTNAYLDYREMLANEHLDIVSVVVPTIMHRQVAEDVINYGLHLLIEKPLALTVEEGERIIELASNKGVILGVGHVERFNPVVETIKGRLDEGMLGKIFQIIIRRTGPFPERIKDTGVILDLAPHDVDLLYFLMPGQIKRIFVEAAQVLHEKYEDIAVSLLRFSDGVIGVLIHNWVSPSKTRDITINGEKGTLVADLLTQDLYFFENNYTASDWESLGVFRGVGEGNMNRFSLARSEPLRMELEAFVRSVIENKPFPVTGEDGLRAMRLANALVECARKNQPI